MQRKIVLITGANSGIGKAAAYKFASAGHKVIMGCRNSERGAAVRTEIMMASGNNDVHLIELDTSSLKSIQAFAAEFNKNFPVLDILINNAAYAEHGAAYRLSSDGIEITFATNVIGPYYLSNLLLNALTSSADARILNASSNIIKHYFSPNKKLTFENIKGINEPGYKHSVYNCYRDSKMAFFILSLRMAEEFRKLNIKVNSLHINGARMSPETLKKFTFPWRMIAYIQNLYFAPAEVMADLYYNICTKTEYKDVTGKLFNHKEKIMTEGPEKPSPKQLFGSDYYPIYAHNKDAAAKIWDICMNLTTAAEQKLF